MKPQNGPREDDKQLALTLREFLFPELKQGQPVSAKAVGRRLSKHLGNPVKHGDRTLVLKSWTNPADPKKLSRYYLEEAI